jgi:hypothetical protein
MQKRWEEEDEEEEEEDHPAKPSFPRGFFQLREAFEEGKHGEKKQLTSQQQKKGDWKIGRRKSRGTKHHPRGK